MLIAAYSCLIDVGAQLRGIPNLVVAKTLLNSRSIVERFNGVLFYDESLNLLHVLVSDQESSSETQFKVIRLSGTDSKSVLAETFFPASSMFLYCDHRQIVGTNITLSDSAVGLVTFGRGTSLRDLQQGVMRLRQYLQGCQTVHLAMT